MAIVASGDAGLETSTEHKKKKIENKEVDLPITMVQQIETADPCKQWVKAWNDIRHHNTTGKYYEPVERQLKLIMEDGICDKMAYDTAGTHLNSCNSCCCQDDKNVFIKDCFFRYHPMHDTIRNNDARRR